jgi:hypothetical protein
MSKSEELNRFLAMAAGASQSESPDEEMLNDKEIQRMIEDFRSQLFQYTGYAKASIGSAQSNKQQKARKKSKAAKQARKKNRKK